MSPLSFVEPSCLVDVACKQRFGSLIPRPSCPIDGAFKGSDSLDPRSGAERRAFGSDLDPLVRARPGFGLAPNIFGRCPILRGPSALDRVLILDSDS